MIHGYKDDEYHDDDSSKIMEDMIRFRMKQRSYSKVEEELLSDPELNKIIKRLDSNKIMNYGMSPIVPSDVVSINYGKGLSLAINIPLSLNQYQYDVEDALTYHKPRLRYKSTSMMRMMKYIVKDKIDNNTAYDIITNLIDSIGYIVICPEVKEVSTQK